MGELAALSIMIAKSPPPKPSGVQVQSSFQSLGTLKMAVFLLVNPLKDCTVVQLGGGSGVAVGVGETGVADGVGGWVLLVIGGALATLFLPA